MKLKYLLLFFFCFILLVEAKKKMRKIKIKKPKPIKIKKPRPIKAHKIHAVHVGKKHRRHKKVHQVMVPRFSPGFNGTDTGQVPADSQVELIEDWLKRIKIVCDVFLSMVEVHADDDERRNLIRNLFPPVRVLLEADYAHSVRVENRNDPARLAAQSMASETTLSFSTASTTNYYPGYVTDTF
jgi:hypothetical protein